MAVCALAATLWLVAALSPASPAAASAESIARHVEERHRAVGGLTARFVQVYRSGVLGREVEERGKLSLKPPGRMLWEYQQPEKKTFVSDGKTFYFYVPADHQVLVRGQAGERGVAVQLLSGQGDLTRDFEAGLETASAGRYRLRLTPRKPDPDVDRVYLETDDAFRIHSIEVLDTLGNRSEFRFLDIKDKVRLPDSLFDFEVPAGVEVVSG